MPSPFFVSYGFTSAVNRVLGNENRLEMESRNRNNQWNMPDESDHFNILFVPPFVSL